MMTNISTPTVVLLRGHISDLRKTRCSQDFFFTDADRAKMGATAIAAGVVGLGGVAVGLSGMAMDTTEEADLIEFELDGKPVKAWVWWSVFSEGDEVEVVAERWGDTWQAFGVRRLSDKIVALHPHCSRGRNAHYRSALKLWFKISMVLIGVLFLFGLSYGFFKYGSETDWVGLSIGLAMGGFAAAAVYGIIAFRIARKFMGFVGLAENIFTGFGWKDVRDIDLPEITKNGKKSGEPDALGVLYFRY
ncbi:putative type VI secretion system effector [Burkholderia cepacia]|uniref:putative type VI secretion system effector n=1 Tax=Burkholderia cepacia TaxID=292 RepID=UPI00158EAB0B|nr:putative type VI secretion system effector [Burkholderia cepacia]MDN7895621.1 putative type VI secretion system effector [Burkholderia cepacia]